VDECKPLHPGSFAAKLKKALPMRVHLTGLDVTAALEQAKALAKKTKGKLMGSESSMAGPSNRFL